MIINKKSADGTVPFYTIPFGKVFIETGSEEVFMKLDTSYNIDGEDYNAVGLRSGQLLHFGDYERVILPRKDPELVIEY
jgi:hypothetical protein